MKLRSFKNIDSVDRAELIYWVNQVIYEYTKELDICIINCLLYKPMLTCSYNNESPYYDDISDFYYTIIEDLQWFFDGIIYRTKYYKKFKRIVLGDDRFLDFCLSNYLKSHNCIRDDQTIDLNRFINNDLTTIKDFIK